LRRSGAGGSQAGKRRCLGAALCPARPPKRRRRARGRLPEARFSQLRLGDRAVHNARPAAGRPGRRRASKSTCAVRSALDRANPRARPWRRWPRPACRPVARRRGRPALVDQQAAARRRRAEPAGGGHSAAGRRTENAAAGAISANALPTGATADPVGANRPRPGGDGVWGDREVEALPSAPSSGTWVSGSPARPRWAHQLVGSQGVQELSWRRSAPAPAATPSSAVRAQESGSARSGLGGAALGRRRRRGPR